MAVRMKRPGKRVLALLGILAVFAAGCIGFTGCQGGSGDTEKIRDLEFTVTGEGEVPQALAELIGYVYRHRGGPPDRRRIQHYR